MMGTFILPQRVTIEAGAIAIDRKVMPLYAGSIHYFRVDRGDWASCLTALRKLGLRFIDLQVPWAVHDLGPGLLEIGQNDPQRDLPAFLKLAKKLGLFCIIRPGPECDAELKHLGLPERIVWDPACQALSAKGHPVVVPALPTMFPAPSLASQSYLKEIRGYFQQLGNALASLTYPNGPIVMCQVETACTFRYRDGLFDRDYHPDSIAKYQAFAKRKYGVLGRMTAAYADAWASLSRMPQTFGEISPPITHEIERPEQLVAALDWAEFQDELLSDATRTMGQYLCDAGFGAVATGSIRQGEALSVAPRSLRPHAIVSDAGDGQAGEAERRRMARTCGGPSTDMAADAFSDLASTIPAGFAPHCRPLSECDNIFSVMCALAYGLRSFRIFMAVGRDRWIGAPVDHHGREQPFADFWRKLCQALETTAFCQLHRQPPVRLVIPPVERRLARAMQAFGGLSGPFVRALGHGPAEACLESTLDQGHHVALAAQMFIRRFESALDARGVPFVTVDEPLVRLCGEALHKKVRWIICASSGALDSTVATLLQQAWQKNISITIGPHAPARDASWKPCALPPITRTAEQLENADAATIDASVDRAIDHLSLDCILCEPAGVFATVHEDDDGRAQVLFVINTGESSTAARIVFGSGMAARDVQAWDDVMDGHSFCPTNAELKVSIPARSVRMLACSRRSPKTGAATKE